jgi:hypothetical protein
MTKRNVRFLAMVGASLLGSLAVIEAAIAGQFGAILTLVLFVLLPISTLVGARDLQRHSDGERVDDELRAGMQMVIVAAIVAWLLSQ